MSGSNRVMEPVNGGFNAVCEVRHGRMVYNINDKAAVLMEEYGECHETEAQIYQQLCLPGSIVVEVGANIGSFSLPIARSIGEKGHLYAFEPENGSFLRLCAMLALNSIENTEVFRMIVSDNEGVEHIPSIVSWQKDQDSGLFGHRFWSQTPTASHQLCKTPVVRLDSFFDLPSLRLLKVDVEGMEMQVFKGAEETIRQHRPLLYLENNRPLHSRYEKDLPGDPDHFEDHMDYLKQHQPEIVSDAEALEAHMRGFNPEGFAESQALIEYIQGLGYRLYWHLAAFYNPDNLHGSKRVAVGHSQNMLALPQEVPGNIDGLDEIADASRFPFVPRVL